MDRGILIFNSVEFGEAIRRRRVELGYTQQQVAGFTGFSPRLIGEIEHGRGTVGIQKVFDVATGLGMDLRIFVRGK